MKFTLTYDGELAANGDKRKKWEIRKHLHPQLQELWSIDRTLKQSFKNRYVPKGGFVDFQLHHSDEEPPPPSLPSATSIDVWEDIIVAGRSFRPIIRKSLNLLCSLKIQFLRKELPGHVYQGGDLDNRLKTLFDGLHIPKPEQVVPDQTVEDPIFCLMEDDAQISHLEVSTHRLLSRPESSVHAVRLIIEADIRVIEPRAYNQLFLGD